MHYFSKGKCYEKCWPKNDLLFYNPKTWAGKKKSKIERLNSKPLDLTKKSGKTILSFTTWWVNEFFPHHILTPISKRKLLKTHPSRSVFIRRETTHQDGIRYQFESTVSPLIKVNKVWNMKVVLFEFGIHVDD